MHKAIVVIFVSCIFFCSSVMADETVNRTITLPGAEADQAVIFHPSEKEYNSAREQRLRLLEAKDPSGCVNSQDGPWMQVQTTAKIGFSIKGVGVLEGKTHVRQVSAAEEALFLYEKRTGLSSCV
jgi:hypothetical protein